MLVRFSSTLLLAVSLLAVAAGAAAQESLQIARERVLSLDMFIDPEPIVIGAAAGPPGVVWRHEVSSRFRQGGGLDGIRVHVSLDAPLGDGWSLHVLDNAGNEVDGTTASTAVPLREFWSRETPGGLAIVELRRTHADTAPRARVSYAYHVSPTEKQAISGKNQLMKIADAPFRVRQLGRSVARLRFIISGQGQATCTAFLVGARLVLTNQHCISNDEERTSALVDFNYDIEGTPTSDIRVAEIVAADPGLDYALLRLASDPPAGTARLYFAPTDWKWTPAPDLHPLVIVQHPSGAPKHASIADCRLSGLDRVGVKPGDRCDFGHLCDTLGGSSGSPVMDWQSGLVVGLHHFGFIEGSNDPVNQAVLYTRILAHVLTLNKMAHAEMIAPRPPG